LQRLRVGFQQLLDDSPWGAEGKPSRTYRFLHFWLLVWRSFVRNRCPVRASALAYVTLLSLIPLLAVVMSVTTTFLKQEGEERIEQFIDQFVASVTPGANPSTNAPVLNPGSIEAPAGAGAGDQSQASGGLSALAQSPEVLRARKEAATYIRKFIQNTRSGALGLTGTVLLIFAAISLLARIEDTLNDIWGVARGRSWFMRIVLYWGVISLAPLLLVAVVGLATGPHLDATRRFVSTLPFVGGFLFHFGLQLLPIVLLCLSFAVLYMLMPNAKVDWRAALVGGLVGGQLFHP
jgi:membrane protein